jgi:hypothetical protein
VMVVADASCRQRQPGAAGGGHVACGAQYPDGAAHRVAGTTERHREKLVV